MLRAGRRDSTILLRVINAPTFFGKSVCASAATRRICCAKGRLRMGEPRRYSKPTPLPHFSNFSHLLSDPHLFCFYFSFFELSVYTSFFSIFPNLCLADGRRSHIAGVRALADLKEIDQRENALYF